VVELRLAVEMMRHCWMRGRSGLSRHFFTLLILAFTACVCLVLGVFGAFVLVSAAIVLISANRFIDVSRRKLIQLLVVSEYDHGDIDLAED